MVVRVGRPLHVTRAESADYDRATLRGLTDRVMNELRDLSGAEYVDRYAAEVKADSRNLQDRARGYLHGSLMTTRLFYRQASGHAQGQDRTTSQSKSYSIRKFTIKGQRHE